MPHMAIGPGSRLGPYEVTALIDEGDSREKVITRKEGVESACRKSNDAGTVATDFGDFSGRSRP
jgi:hypothetical protein